MFADTPRSAGSAGPRTLSGVMNRLGDAEHVVDHRPDDGLRLVAEDELEDVDVRAREARCLRETAQPLGGPVRSCLPCDRVLLAQGLPERASLAPGHPFVTITLSRADE